MYKIEGKTVDTRGLFIVINVDSQETIVGLCRKGEVKAVCIDCAHLFRAFEQASERFFEAAGHELASRKRDWRGVGPGERSAFRPLTTPSNIHHPHERNRDGKRRIS
jgi:hypothetical protein